MVLWKHDSLPTKFWLCVDDFVIKHFSRSDAEHLLNTLRQHYKVNVIDWEGRSFCGITFDWNYENKYADISMPKYINNILHRFQHLKPNKPQ